MFLLALEWLMKTSELEGFFFPPGLYSSVNSPQQATGPERRGL